MRVLQRAAFGLYLGHFATLIRFAAFLFAAAERSVVWRHLLAAIRSGLRDYYAGVIISAPAAEAMIEETSLRVRAPCICATFADVPPLTEGGCFYLNDAAEAYERRGPRRSRRVSVEECRAELRGCSEGTARLMTVRSRVFCPFFPTDYVVCTCSPGVCLPWRWAELFPEMTVVETGSPPRSSALIALLRFVVTFPLGVGAFIYWRLGEWRGPILSATALIAASVASGAVIAQRPMWAYLHSPQWSLNAYWTALLPLGALGELATAGLLLRAWLRRRGQSITRHAFWSVLLRAFLAFQLVHLARFVLVAALRERYPLEVTRALFWSFDAVAWVTLGIALWAGLRRARREPSVPAAGP